MAMRGRGGGRGNPNRPPRVIVNRVYEQFKPMSEWRQEDGYDTLLVYLPGFQKEYIKVTTEDLNIVRVRGERLVAENKWSRFQEDYRVPENCEMRGIRAKFDGGILTITMPRKIVNAPPPPPPSVTTTARVAPKTVEQPQKPEEEPTEKKPNKPQTRRVEDNTLPPPPPPPKPTSSSAPIIERPRKPNAEPKETKPDKPQTSRLEDYTLPPPPKPTSSSAPPKQPPSKLAPEAKDVVRDRFEQNVIEKPVSEKTNLAEGKETMLKEETKRDIEGSKGKPSNSGVVGGGLQGIVAMRGIKEDRKLLVNVGVGVLIIVALGVHVSYTMGLIGKGE